MRLSTVYWPGIEADIAAYVNCCKTCTQHKAKQAVQPMLLRDVPDSLWQDLAADFFTYNHIECFLIVDTFSKYPFIYQTSSISAKSIIKKLQNLISQYGPPKRFFSDNGPPFSSEALPKVPCIPVHRSHHFIPPLTQIKWLYKKCKLKQSTTALDTGNFQANP